MTEETKNIRKPSSTKSKTPKKPRTKKVVQNKEIEVNAIEPKPVSEFYLNTLNPQFFGKIAFYVAIFVFGLIFAWILFGQT